jgi:hypothetical protein
MILTLPFAITIRYSVVAREEAHLERRFGDAYRDTGWLSSLTNAAPQRQPRGGQGESQAGS